MYQVGDTMGKAATAKLFRNGRSQAVRLPKDFRFPGDEVRIRREGDAVVLEPLQRKAWPRGYWDRLREIQHVAPIATMNVQLQDVDLDTP